MLISRFLYFVVDVLIKIDEVILYTFQVVEREPAKVVYSSEGLNLPAARMDRNVCLQVNSTICMHFLNDCQYRLFSMSIFDGIWPRKSEV